MSKLYVRLSERWPCSRRTMFSTAVFASFIDYVQTVHYETHPYNIQRFFSSKIGEFQWKNVDTFFFIFAQNIDCGYT